MLSRYLSFAKPGDIGWSPSKGNGVRLSVDISKAEATHKIQVKSSFLPLPLPTTPLFQPTYPCLLLRVDQAPLSVFVMLSSVSFTT